LRLVSDIAPFPQVALQLIQLVVSKDAKQIFFVLQSRQQVPDTPVPRLYYLRVVMHDSHQFPDPWVAFLLYCVLDLRIS
jgi:hypothetical protein